jgi:HSP20 family protein
MSVRDLIPWGRSNNRAPIPYREDDRSNPFLSLHREMNRLFDDFFRDFDMRLPMMGGVGFNGGWPHIDVSETDKEVTITAELPGMEEKDVELLLEDGVLKLKGEKRAESEDKDRQFSERYYGHFERRIPLDAEVQADKAQARFKNGVLTVTLPKNPEAQPKSRRIAIGH